MVRSILFSLLLPSLVGTSHAQNIKPESLVLIRAILHDPARVVADLYLADPAGDLVKLQLRTGNLSAPQPAILVNGTVRFYNSSRFDPEDPDANLATTLKVPTTLKKLIVILTPIRQGASSVLKAVPIDDSPNAFPGGESRVLSLIAGKTAVQAGEHRVGVQPGRVARIPAVKKRNNFNIAQTNFYCEKGGAWSVFTERQVKYHDRIRRIYLITVFPGAKHPYVTTFVDTAPPAVPKRMQQERRQIHP